MQRICVKVYFTKEEVTLIHAWRGSESLSGFVRRASLNQSATLGGKNGEDHPTKNVRQVREVPVAERRTGVVPRASRTPERAAKKAGVEVCRHNLSECTICG